MPELLTDVPLRPKEQVATSTTSRVQALKQQQPAVFWPWLSGLLVVGVIIVLSVTSAASNWLNGLQHSTDTGSALPIATIHVQRSAVYMELHMQMLNVQYAPTFSDDLIHTSSATVRVNLHVTNPTKNAQGIAYYDSARLLVPKQQPLAPTNLNLSAQLQGGSSQTGWIDFPVPKNTVLKTLVFQLGNVALGETLVTIPVGSAYTAGQYDDHLYTVNMNINYLFQGYRIPAYWLNYHLKTVETRYSYHGSEASAGNQFYILNFTVDNPNNVQVQPGFGYDYVRLEVNGGHTTPQDNSLPYTFAANEHGLSGYIVFEGLAHLHPLSIAFLIQAHPGWSTYSISL